MCVFVLVFGYFSFLFFKVAMKFLANDCKEVASDFLGRWPKAETKLQYPKWEGIPQTPAFTYLWLFGHKA